ncbi:LLM class F420-dependent oxidoreductase [Streptomyces sp. TS71-3]|uniref:LLM class F420-dependent oxidoreductase n=1 Tax=Streptomyces sp. TS71-3 TaxID=2733862 RepID=UPI001B221103|nr:LLM class F420-dependent oxidoreductase [Streptomyces sp. TS71-3]GHJ42169.1 LLM class F420-dependent oxidoreductase [Streptomyces sp. TS71-3]
MSSDKLELFGRIGIWSPALRTADADPARRGEVTEAVAALDELGYGTVWIGASPSVADAANLVQATPRITVATGILSIWSHTAEDVAAQTAQIEERAPGRFVLGIGVSHDALTPDYAKPYSRMVEYLDALDAAARPVPAERRVLAALGPKMLRLSAERAGGAHPYLITVQHVRQARELLGPEPLLAPELKVVPEPDLEKARTIARGVLAMYLQLPNYTSNLLRLGFEEGDFENGGSNRLLDALFALGGIEEIQARVEEFHAAGADHVALQVLTERSPEGVLPLDEWRELSAAFSLR